MLVLPVAAVKILADKAGTINLACLLHLACLSNWPACIIGLPVSLACLPHWLDCLIGLPAFFVSATGGLVEVFCKLICIQQNTFLRYLWKWLSFKFQVHSHKINKFVY
jgi:hypothetical protein